MRCAPLTIGLLDRRGVDALLLGPRHLVAGGVLLALQPFDLGQQTAAFALRASRATAARPRGWCRVSAACRARRRTVLSAGPDRARPDCTWVTIGRMTDSVRTAVFPAAGLGTRFLPATKAQPKEMLVLVDKPVIQYGVEEAVASGINNIVIVTGRGKNAIEDHFDRAVELESFLEQRGKKEQLEEIRKITQLINVAYVAAGRAARTRPRGARRQEPRRRRAVRGRARRRRDRRHATGAEADDRGLRSRRTDRCWPSSACRRGRLELRHRGGRRIVGPGAGRAPHHQPGRKTAARGGALEPRDHRPLHPHARHLPGARGHGPRSHGRNSADERAARAAENAADLRLRDLRSPARHRQQAGVPEGARLLRAASGPTWRSRSATISNRSI